MFWYFFNTFLIIHVKYIVFKLCRGSQEWAVPHQTKLKYTQLFNTTDRMRTGFLTGVQARGIMVATQLPQNVLAQIW